MHVVYIYMVLSSALLRTKLYYDGKRKEFKENCIDCFALTLISISNYFNAPGLNRSAGGI